VHSFDRVHEERGRAGRTQGGRNLARNDATFSHASYYNPSFAREEQLHRLIESACHGTGNTIRERSQRFGLNADYAFTNVFHGKRMLAVMEGDGRRRPSSMQRV
jgi:hypothetical protein